MDAFTARDDSAGWYNCTDYGRRTTEYKTAERSTDASTTADKKRAEWSTRVVRVETESGACNWMKSSCNQCSLSDLMEIDRLGHFIEREERKEKKRKDQSRAIENGEGTVRSSFSQQNVRSSS